MVIPMRILNQEHTTYKAILKPKGLPKRTFDLFTLIWDIKPNAKMQKKDVL